MIEIVAVCLSDRKGTVKTPVASGRLVADFGFEGDAHAGSERQVSLLPRESARKMEGKGAEIVPGIFAENLLLEGLPIDAVAVGQVYELSAGPVLEVTRIGKPCHHGCAIRQLVGDCVMPREGFFVRVVKGGDVRPGDHMRLRERTTS